MTLFTLSHAEFTSHAMAHALHIPVDISARIIEKIAHIDRINTSAASYYPILSQAFIQERGYSVGCEIGVFTGGHAEYMLAHSNLQTLYCVDPYAPMQALSNVTEGLEQHYWKACWDIMYHYVVNRLSRFGDRAQILRLQADQVAKMIADDSLDFVFIDGDHSYHAVLADCSNYYAKVRSGGIVSGDDYNLVETGQAIRDFFGKKNLTINIYPGQQRFWWVEKP